MQQRTLIFFSILIFFHQVWANIVEHSGYRIIRTSPYALVSALRIAPTNQLTRKEGSTRLARFFRVKNKHVIGKTIELDVIPDVPLLSEYFENRNFLHVKLEERANINQSYVFDVYVSTQKSQKIYAQMDISPHELGSLLSLKLMNSAFSDFTLKSFELTLSALGFLSKTPEDAILVNSKIKTNN